VSEPTRTHRFRIAGMSGEDCAATVERALLVVPGVQNAIVDVDRAEAVVRAASYIGVANLTADVESAVTAAGYTFLMAANGDPAPTPEPIPEPTPEPVPAPRPAAPAGEPAEQPQSEGWRAWIPPWSTVWYAASRAVIVFFAASLFFTIVFRFLPVPFTLLMVGETLFEGRDIRRQWMPLERISPHLIRAVIASEDNEFCHHWGIDFKELEVAWERSQRNGGRLRGASTISQQTAKNVFLWPGRSYLRKGLEAYFTGLIEVFWPKRRIMEVYLNVIEWGPGVFGAEAAARHWFRKPASRLTRIEAARLAAILPNPNRYRANPPGPYVNGRSYTIAARADSVNLYGDDRCARP
jgi:monofunctional biosynthetic peptidoglycan transglycosylase